MLRDQADKIIHWIDRFKAVGDVAVNADPIHAGLPWASLRLLLEVCIRIAGHVTQALLLTKE